VTPDDFNDLFDAFQFSAFRMETRQEYTIEEDREAIAGWREGRARPAYSVRTSPWAARLATSSIAGKLWQRVRVVEMPLSDYVRWETAAYVESSVLGEEIRVLVRTPQKFAELIDDFWIFDAGESSAKVVAVRYDDAGRPAGNELITDPDAAAAYTDLARRAWNAATPLNEFLVAGTSLRRTA
jgi:hypothetical protein